MKKMLVLFAVLMLALPLAAQQSDNMKKGDNMKADSMKADMKGDSMKGGVAQAITQMEQEWASNAKMGKMDAVAANLADSYMELDGSGAFYTRAQSIERMKEAKWQTNEVSDIKVTVHGNTAIASGAWHGQGTVAGKAVDEHENWIDTWMKMANGKWQCIASASVPTKAKM